MQLVRLYVALCCESYQVVDVLLLLQDKPSSARLKSLSHMTASEAELSKYKVRCYFISLTLLHAGLTD